MHDCKPALTPLPHKVVIGPRGPDEQPLPPQTPYRSLIGALLYVAMWTRPDIAFAVSQVSRWQSDPSTYHWDLAKSILRYLKGTRTRGLTFSPGAGDAGVGVGVGGIVVVGSHCCWVCVWCSFLLVSTEVIYVCCAYCSCFILLFGYCVPSFA